MLKKLRYWLVGKLINQRVYKCDICSKMIFRDNLGDYWDYPDCRICNSLARIRKVK